MPDFHRLRHQGDWGDSRATGMRNGLGGVEPVAVSPEAGPDRLLRVMWMCTSIPVRRAGWRDDMVRRARIGGEMADPKRMPTAPGSTIRRRKPGGYVGFDRGIADTSSPKGQASNQAGEFHLRLEGQ